MQPVRTALFAPGIKERVMSKALESGADAVILDLEDSVPLASKAEARALVAKAIDAATNAPSHPAIYVRVNAASTGLLLDDLEAVTRPGLDAVLLSKAETVKDVQQCAAALDRHEAQGGMKAGLGRDHPADRKRARRLQLLQPDQGLAARGCDLLRQRRDGDLQSDLGCSWSIEGTELLYARSKVLLDTRAAGGAVFPLDGVFADLNDEAGLIADSRLSARLGYIGRTVIHPKQIAPVKAAYAVPEAEVAYYKKISAEFAAAEKAGVAAIAVDGKLVDYAMAQRARRVLALASLDAPR